jgi:hypothetical protein
MFHFRDGMLHLGDTCFFVAPGSCDECSILRAWGRLTAEAMDSEVAMDGTKAFMRSGGFGTLSNAIATLASRHPLTLIDDSALSTPGLKLCGENVEVRVTGTWNLKRLANIKGTPSTTEAHQVVYHEEYVPCFAFALEKAKIPENLVPPPTVYWMWVYRTKYQALRVCKVEGPLGYHSGAEFTVHLYRCGILWMSESHSTEHVAIHGAVFYVDVITSVAYGTESLEWIPTFPDVIDEDGSSIFGLTFLNTSCITDLSQSVVVARLMACAYSWRSFLCERWTFPGDRIQGLVNVLQDERVSDDILKLIDGTVLIKQVRKDDRIDLIGTILLRRLQTVTSSRSADHKVSVRTELSIGQFGIFPIHSSRYAHLYDLGIMNQLDNISAYGVLFGNSSCRTLALPNDSTPSHVAMGLSSLCSYDVEIDEADSEMKEIIEISPGVLLSEASYAGYTSNDKLSPYYVRINIQDGCVILTQDPHTPIYEANGVISIDELSTGQFTCDANRTRRPDMMSIFPKLARRLELQNNTIEACVREAQARRTSSEWSLEALDCGGNLTSMGMTVMMALVLTGWMGIRVRVFLGRCRSALLGVLNEMNGYYQLVDCTKTTRNTFEIAPHLSGCPESGKDICVRKGMLIEVRPVAKWHLAQIIKLCPDSMSAHIQYIGNERQEWISLSSQCWRRLSDENSDVDKVIRFLIKNKKQPHIREEDTADDPCASLSRKRKATGK